MLRNVSGRDSSRTVVSGRVVKTRVKPRGLLVACLPLMSFIGGEVQADQLESKGFIEDSKLSVLAKNYYFNTDRANDRSNQKDWSQAFIANYVSGFTQGTLGFGVDAFGL